MWLERSTSHEPRRIESFCSVPFNWSACRRLYSPCDARHDFLAPRESWYPTNISDDLECCAMSGSRIFSAADWPRINPALGLLSFNRPIDANSLAFGAFGSDLSHFASVDK